jgi:succinyl-CoA synthetase alpha subunit
MNGILKYLAGIDTPKVLVFGITGRQGQTGAKLMMKMGTTIVAGCTPGKGNQEVEGIPVFNSAAEAVKAFPELNCAISFVPGGAVFAALKDAAEAGLKFSLHVADGVPTHDAILMKEFAQSRGHVYIGPNTVGLLDTAGYLFGMIGGSASWAKKNYLPGSVGVISRSGGLSQLLGAFHCRPNLPGPREDGSFGPLWDTKYPGVSAVICVGGDPIPGVTLLNAARAFQQDPRTRVIVAYGETGTTQENDLAAAVAAKEITKPVIMYLGGRYTKAGVAQSHAGAMIRNEAETYAFKRRVMEEAGITVVERPDAVFAQSAARCTR